MIAYNLRNVNNFDKQNKENYNNTLNFNIGNCPNCKSNNIIKWGSYTRNYIYYINKQKVEDTIVIKRIKCKDCQKTHAIIPIFIIPYKQHSLNFINKVLYMKNFSKKTYKEIENKLDISRQLLYHWIKCLKKHSSRILVTLEVNNLRLAMKKIKNDLFKFIYQYYIENRQMYMMFVNTNYNGPILKWAPT